MDLVVLVGSDDYHKLVFLSEDKKYPVRYGGLNLIPVSEQSDFDAWKACTDFLVENKPVTRDVAVAEFSKRGITGYKAGPDVAFHIGF